MRRLAILLLALALPAAAAGAPRHAFAGSDRLALQIPQGQPTDIFAAAS